MAIKLEQFVEQLTQTGLLSAAEVSTFQQSLPQQRQPRDAEGLARELVNAKRLTRYQAAAIAQGQAKSLVFDEYVILDKLGQGGMGVVLKAQHRRMKRQVAIKIIAPAAVKSPEAVRRFYREVEVAARLTHPNIVAAHDAREYHGSHCLVMEYVEGRDLAAIVKEHGPLPVRQAVECVVQAARGLDYAHARGVVHRDIKPANLLLDRDGTVKILDMGLARIEQESGGLGGGQEDRLTQSGQVMGTCDYMAPEQSLDTHKADHRADIYSLGCTLYRLITGRTPYAGETYAKLFMAHLNDPIPSLCEARPEVSGQLDAAFRKMVAKRPEDRQQSMAAVIADLEACLGRGQAASEESLGDGALAFLREMTQGATATRQKVQSRTEETMAPNLHPETGTNVGVRLWRGRRGRNRVVLGMAAAGAAALVALGVIITLRHPDGKTTTLHVPDGSRVAIGEKGQVDVTLNSREVKRAVPPVTGGFNPALATGRFEDKPVAKAATGEPIRHPLSRATYKIQHEGQTIEVPVGMVFVPGGPFLMGDGKLKVATPVHRVDVPAFFIDKYEVTNAQYREFVQATSHAMPEAWRKNGNRIPPGRESHPVTILSWNDADAYARWCGKRLPTEAEWEKAAAWDPAKSRHRKFPWGDDDPDKDPKAQHANTAYFWGHSRGPDGPAWHDGFRMTDVGRKEFALGGATKPVGSFPTGVSAYGCYDMTGNIGEWVADWFDVYPGESQMEPKDRVDCGQRKRVYRDGGWSSCGGGNDLQCAGRMRAEPWKAISACGVRCAADYPWKKNGRKIENASSGAAGQASQPSRPSPYLGTDGEWKLPPGAPPPGVNPFDFKRAREHQEAWAKHLGVPVEVTDSLGIQFVLIPPGEFMMGSTPEEIEQELAKAGQQAQSEIYLSRVREEGPLHRVRLGRPFYLGRFEVTQAQYEKVMRRLPGKQPDAKIDKKTQPVDEVTWNEAIEFCGKAGDHLGYRLPTEAEWEYACRSGSAARWCFGDDRGLLEEYAWLSERTLHPIGQKKPNGFGLHDMHGNAWEWCSDWSGRYPAGPVMDPVGPVSGATRVTRGGLWGATPCRSASRRIAPPDTWRLREFGFRVAKDVDVPKTRPASAGESAAEPRSSYFVGPDGKWKLPPNAPPPAVAPFDAKKAREHQEAWAKYLKVPVEMTNSVGMKFKLVPPGEFEMGATPEQIRRMVESDVNYKYAAQRRILCESAAPKHRVRITHPLYVGRYEVTQAEYQQVTGVNPSSFCGHAAAPVPDDPLLAQTDLDMREHDRQLVAGQDTGRHPVETVGWESGQEFARKLAALAPEQAAGWKYRLPTEAEWEYACRAGTTGLWPCGTEDKLSEFAWHSGASRTTQPVGQKQPNAWGLYDMLGNVFEWCEDWFGQRYYQDSPAADPPGESTGERHVARGGAWFTESFFSHSAFRLNFDHGGHQVGIRVVCPIPMNARR